MTNTELKIMSYSRLKEIFDETKAEVIEVFPSVEYIAYSVNFNARFKSVLGRCTKLGPNYYRIEINPKYASMVKLEELKNTIVHELLHSLPNCMNHKEPWKNAAILMKRKGYDIQRQGSQTEYSQYRRDTAVYKYEVYCSVCGNKWRRKRDCDLTQSIKRGDNRYYCSCGHKPLQIKEL